MDSNSNEKKYNKIAYRIETIQDMIKDQEVESIVDYSTNSDEMDSVVS